MAETIEDALLGRVKARIGRMSVDELVQWLTSAGEDVQAALQDLADKHVESRGGTWLLWMPASLADLDSSSEVEAPADGLHPHGGTEDGSNRSVRRQSSNSRKHGSNRKRRRTKRSRGRVTPEQAARIHAALDGLRKGTPEYRAARKELRNELVLTPTQVGAVMRHHRQKSKKSRKQ